jgi:hypothetical protein
MSSLNRCNSTGTMNSPAKLVGVELAPPLALKVGQAYDIVAANGY